MALTRYCTATQVRGWLSKANSTRIDDAGIEDCIDNADIEIRSKIGNLVDFDAVDALSTVPDWLNKLSIWKSNEYTLVKLFGGKRDVNEVSDIQYWQEGFDKMINDIKTGATEIVDGDGNSLTSGSATFSNRAKSNIKPPLGESELGEFLSKTELEEKRPL